MTNAVGAYLYFNPVRERSGAVAQYQVRQSRFKKYIFEKRIQLKLAIKVILLISLIFLKIAS
jgi:hypothetical protein